LSQTIVNILIEKLGNKSKKTEAEHYIQRFRTWQISGYYGGVHIINISKLSTEDTIKEIEEIVFNKSEDHLVPNIENFTDKEFNDLKFLIEGESKIVRKYNDKLNIIRYKASVYSHKMQRGGNVDGTDYERISVTKNILDIFSRHCIKHTYLSIGKQYILSESINIETDIPPIEVIVKRCFIGSDKHRYYGMEKVKTRFGTPLVSEELKEYPEILVRYDYRNPNFHPETGIPIGDMLICDDLADQLINVEVSKKAAKHIFRVLMEHFEKMNIYMQDICLMLTVDGDKLYGEVSQDCGRYKYKHEHTLTDLDKDIWRAGGSSDLVLEKYKKLTSLVKAHVRSLYEN